MKKTKKALLLSLCAVMLVTASVLGTMAYLTSTDEVVNTFTVGNVAIPSLIGMLRGARMLIPFTPVSL